MLQNRLKHIGIAGLLSSLLLLSGCSQEEEAFATGALFGTTAGVALASYSYPHYYGYPYYYYGGRYYYGGYYRNGYYYYRGHRYRGGHYYHHGYRYHNGRRYRAQSGRYGYYRNASEYRKRGHHSRKSQYGGRSHVSRRQYQRGSHTAPSHGRVRSRTTYRSHR